MRGFAVLMLALSTACAGKGAPVLAAPTTDAPCRFEPADSAWLDRAIRGWRRVGERRLELSAHALPPLILFDTRCVHHLHVGTTWRVRTEPHRGVVRLPNGLAIAPIGIGITSPTRGDTAIFLALALPESWRADPRYRGTNDTRDSWERYLVRAFTHEMTHAHMLPGLVSRLRALEASIFPDTIEDNIVQARFGQDRDFAQAVLRETDLLYRAASAATVRARQAYVRAALTSMDERRRRFYTGDSASWRELEQTLLDLEGVAQWAALGHVTGGATTGATFERALAQFRAGREFWSEDHGLALILALDRLVPDWQRQLISATPTSSFALLTQALADSR